MILEEITIKIIGVPENLFNKATIKNLVSFNEKKAYKKPNSIVDKNIFQIEEALETINEMEKRVSPDRYENYALVKKEINTLSSLAKGRGATYVKFIK